MRALFAIAVLAACGNDSIHHLADGGGAPDARADARPDARPDGAGSGADAPPADAPIDHDSTIFITQSPGGSNGTAAWQGILQFQVDGDGSPLVAGAGLGSAAVADPVGLVFHPSTQEVLVGNRHGNIAADGVAGSISRFLYHQQDHSLTAHGEITGNGLSGVHQVTFSPTTGELFAANNGGNVSRFTFDALGAPTANGSLPLSTVRGVVVAPDGKRLYATSASNTIHQFDLATGDELAPVTLATTGNLHFFALRAGQLYVAALADGQVDRYTIEADDSLTFVDSVAADSPLGIAFSADGLEMFVTGHQTSDVLDRFSYDAASDTWTRTAQIDEGSSLGGIVIVPG